ncbi:MAG: TetR/AcrR family transcriptional regulator [Bacteroidota bacterium]|nr:TetR/AcrR family transcriptional regulator [Bacteroidota bacterium]
MEPKELILQGAEELFTRYGIKSITMDELSHHLSMSKKTIYQYFKDKDQLVLEVLHSHMSKQKCDMDNIFNTNTDVIKEMFEATIYMRNMTNKINPSILFDMRKYHPNAYATFQKFKKEYIVENIKKSLQKGIDQGYFRKDIDIEILAKLRVEEIEIGFNMDVFPIGSHEFVEIHDQLFTHFIYGVCTIKGHKRFNELKEIIE